MPDNKEIRLKIEAQIVDSNKEYAGATSGTADFETNIKSKAKRSEGISKAITVNLVTKGAQYAISNYGNLTGDYVTQSNINSLIEIGGLAAMAATGPAGMAAAGISLAVKGVNYYIDRSKKHDEIDFLRQRVGMTNGRSR